MRVKLEEETDKFDQLIELTLQSEGIIMDKVSTGIEGLVIAETKNKDRGSMLELNIISDSVSAAGEMPHDEADSVE